MGHDATSDVIKPSKEGQRMLMQEDMWQPLWVQEERF